VEVSAVPRIEDALVPVLPDDAIALVDWFAYNLEDLAEAGRLTGVVPAERDHIAGHELMLLFDHRILTS
jgi:hypothetical protein